MSQYKFIEDALKKEAPYVIGELRKELENQKHIASGKLYNGFYDKISIGSNSISLLITNDTPYMWLVNDGKSGGVTAGYDALRDWTFAKEKRGELSFSNAIERKRFINTIKANLEKQYFSKSGDRNVAPYGEKRYFFIDIAKNKVEASNIDKRIREGVVAEIEDDINKALLKEKITLTIG